MHYDNDSDLIAMSKSNNKMEIPGDLTSPSTLVYLGIVPAVAQDIHERWVDVQNDPSLASFHWVPLYESAKMYIGHQADDRDYFLGDCADMEKDLRSMGATEELITGIVDPRFAAVRKSKTAREWFLDSMKMRYAYLEDVLNTEESSSTLPEHNNNMPTMNVDGELWAHGSTTPGHTTLYKAMSRTTAEHLWKGIWRHGKLDLSSHYHGLLSDTRSDFSARNMCYHFTPDWEVAHLHAESIESRLMHSSACVIRIDVPDSILEDPKHRVYRAQWNSNAWRQSIFWSRLGEPLDRNFDDPVGSALVIADCSSINYQTIAKMKDWGEIGRDHVFWLNASQTRAAKQYIFWGDIEDKIEAECQEKVWLYRI